MPGRVFFLFLDVVQPGRRFEAFLADRDGVGLGQLQVFPEPQGEGASVECQVGREGGGNFLGRNLGFRVVGAGGDRVIGVGVEHGGLDLLGEQVVAQLAPVLCLDDAERVGGRFDGRILGFAIYGVGDVAHEAPDRRLGVGDVGRDLIVDAAAGDIADQAPRKAAVPALGQGFFDRDVEVGTDLESRARQPPFVAVVTHAQRVAQGAE